MFAPLFAFASRLRAWFSPRQVDREFESELENHLDLLTQENLRRGLSPEEAARAARIRLGGATQLKETNRELRGLPLLETLLQDLRYAFRMLRKNPGFTAVAVLTLAIGIGANTAIFSVVYAVLLKPMPYADSGRLFNVFQQQARNESAKTGFSYLNLSDLRAENHIFEELAGAQRHQLTLTGHGDPTVVNTSVVTPELFSVFSVAPLLGRTFTPEDGKRGAPAVVLLGENLWRADFGADPRIIGSSITLDQHSFTIVGVLPAAFRFPAVSKNKQLWIPLVDDPVFGAWMDGRGGHWLQVTGRLRSGVSLAQAQSELDALAARFAQEFPKDNEGWLIRMVPLQQMLVGNVRTALLVLLGAVGLVLLIACANIANLLLSRATARTREIAVRATLGAGRSRIVRQLMSETAVLGLLGGLLGVLLALWGVRGLVSLLPETVPKVNDIRVDYLVLGFALLLSVLAACIFGLAPAFIVAKSDLHASLREGGRSGESSAGRRARNILAAGELALAMVLLVAAGLLIRSFSNLTAVDPGFKPERIVKADISLPLFEYSTQAQWAAFSDELMKKIQAQPGLQDSAIAVPLPIVDGFVNLGFDIVGAPPRTAAESRTANYASVSGDYFRVMGIPLLSGRYFEGHDAMTSSRVTLINRAFARIYFPNQDPIGKQIVFNFPPNPASPRQIVGVVGDVRDVSLGNEPGPMMYVPFAQAPFWGGGVIVRSSLPASVVGAAIRQTVAGIDKDLPVTDISTLRSLVDESVAQPRFRTLLLSIFAALAVLLAATGIFGVISYSVSCRTQEIGIRVALGASRRSISRMVFRETLLLAAAGLAFGIPGALAASHLLGHLLFGVSANDPATLVAVAATLVVVAVTAAYVPVRRAVRVDPMLALRHT